MEQLFNKWKNLQNNRIFQNKTLRKGYKYVFHNIYLGEVIFKKKQQDFFTSKK